MRILIIEDEIIIAQFIEHQMRERFNADTKVVLEAEGALAALADFLPHLVLCDIELKGPFDGIELMHQLKKPIPFELIFVTSYRSRRMIDRAYSLHPTNYIIKPLDENRLYASILPAIQKIGSSITEEPDEFRLWLTGALTQTELTILQLIAKGKSSKEIADTLYVSPHTIKNHRNHICRKLDLDEGHNALLRWALKHCELICWE